MKTLNALKQTLYFIVLLIGLSSVSFAQAVSSPPSGPGGACPGNTCPSPGYYPNTSWPFVAPANNTKAMPTIDANSAHYLPYLPWMAANMAALVNYSDFFYRLAKDTNGNGSNIPYGFSTTTSANNSLSKIQASNMTEAANQTQKKLQQFLSFDPNGYKDFTKLSYIPGTDTDIPCASGKCPPPSDNSAFNADTIFGVTNYPATQKQQDGSSTPTPQAQSINNLIMFLSNITQPLPNPGLSTDPTTRQSELGNSSVQSYLMQVRTLAALRSMALSNFNFLAQERAVVPGLGANANMIVIPTSPDQCSDKAKTIADASQLQLDKFMLDRRLNNPCWYANMNSASPAALQRETLFVLVELQRQLYETQMLHERVLATLSTMQMAMTQMGSGNLSVQASNVQNCLKDPKQCGIAG
jgi:hypothetical protein